MKEDLDKLPELTGLAKVNFINSIKKEDYSVEDFKEIIKRFTQVKFWNSYVDFTAHANFIKALLKLNKLKKSDIKQIYLLEFIRNFSINNQIINLFAFIKNEITEKDFIEILEKIIEHFGFTEATLEIKSLLENLLKYNGLDYTQMSKEFMRNMINKLIEMKLQIEVPEDKQKFFIYASGVGYQVIKNLSEEFAGLKQLGDLGL